MTELKGLTVEEISNFLQTLDIKETYRAQQLAKWIYQKKTNDFSLMTDISKKTREIISSSAKISNLKIREHFKDPLDFAQKILIELDDGNFIESVIIPDDDRNTICVSSQCGCALNCEFCATGKALPFKRNLTAFEIIEQIFICDKILTTENKKITNIVFMGMGEPFLNFENVINVCKILTSHYGFAFAAHRITISTAGLTPEIRKFADLPIKIELAVSLNAVDDITRSKIMPINKKYNLDDLCQAIEYYNHQRPKQQCTCEYVMLAGINDDENSLRKLIKLARRLNCKINLIKFNKTSFTAFQPSDDKRLDYFFEELNRNNVRAIIRRSKGANIFGACGQLAGLDGKYLVSVKSFV